MLKGKERISLALLVVSMFGSPSFSASQKSQPAKPVESKQPVGDAALRARAEKLHR
jgi:hypothetical protein